jgi:cyclopropane-fatty-acyl-phospholipid synthase
MGECCWCCAIPVLFLAALAGCAQYFLSQPRYAERAVHKLVELGHIPATVWDSIQIKDETMFYDIITKMNLGIAEGYMHGKVDIDLLPFFLAMLNETSVGSRRHEGSDLLYYVSLVATAPTNIKAYLSNQQTRELSSRVTKEHYDAGNDLYEVMLGPTMSYSCAYWRGAKNLDEAQRNKFDLVFRKLESAPGMKILDVGMGWGTAAAYMHEHGKVDVTGLSLSEEQVKWAQQHLTKPGLRFIWADYRDHCEDPGQIGTYDRVYSIGMLEHVGTKNYKSFFKCIKELLKPDGLAVVHSIGEPDFVPASDPFLDTYIFPGAVIPAMSMLVHDIEKNFILEDFQNFGFDYSLTLAAWYENSEKFFKDHPAAYTLEFQRMWRYYLKMCEALFTLRINQLWHFVLSPRPAYRKRVERQL